MYVLGMGWGWGGGRAGGVYMSTWLFGIVGKSAGTEVVGGRCFRCTVVGEAKGTYVLGWGLGGGGEGVYMFTWLFGIVGKSAGTDIVGGRCYRRTVVDEVKHIPDGPLRGGGEEGGTRVHAPVSDGKMLQAKQQLQACATCAQRQVRSSI